MKKIKIGLTAIALSAGILSIFVAKAKAFANTAYWIDFRGNKTTSAPTDVCPGGTMRCATAYNINGVPTGHVLSYNP